MGGFQAFYRVLLSEPELLSKKKSEKKIAKAVIDVRSESSRHATSHPSTARIRTPGPSALFGGR